MQMHMLGSNEDCSRTIADFFFQRLFFIHLKGKKMTYGLKKTHLGSGCGH
jgi:hypothetical protein